MITINFYKLFEKGNLLSAISLISNKILEADEKVILFLEGEDEMKQMDEKLWSFSQSEFIPHLSENSEEFEEFKDETPILLTTKQENTISATNLIIFKKPQNIEFFKQFNRVFFLFSQENEEELLKAREFWKEVSGLKQEFASKFYEQGSDKKWNLKA